MEQELLKDFKSLETGSSFISKNSKEFSQKYEKKFVAVYNSSLIAVDESFEEVIKKVREKNIDPSVVLIEYIPPKGQIILY